MPVSDTDEIQRGDAMTESTPDATDATPSQEPQQQEQQPHDDAAIDEAPAADTGTDAEVLPTAELEEPSTEKPPGEEPKAPARADAEPSHQAIGIGVIDED
jgi:hypothetical protein